MEIKLWSPQLLPHRTKCGREKQIYTETLSSGVKSNTLNDAN